MKESSATTFHDHRAWVGEFRRPESTHPLHDTASHCGVDKHKLVKTDGLGVGKLKRGMVER